MIVIMVVLMICVLWRDGAWLLSVEKATIIDLAQNSTQLGRIDPPATLAHNNRLAVLG